MSQLIDEEVRDFVKKELPLITTLFLKVIEVRDDSTLQDVYEPDDIDEMLEKYFQRFNVDRGAFSPGNYFPWETKSFFSSKTTSTGKKALTIQMLIESAKAGRWLFD